MRNSQKILIASVALGVILGLGAYAYTSNISNPQDVTDDYISVELKKDSLSKGNDLTNEFYDESFRELIRETLGKTDSNKIYKDDIESYLNRNNYILKLTLNSSIKSLKGLELFSKVNSVWLTNGTNDYLDYSTLSELKDLKTLTIINCKLTPSDISSSIWHSVYYNKLEELFINAAIPGNRTEKYKGVKENAQGLNSPYTSALNSLGESNNSNYAGHHGLKVLSLVGNEWQGDISTLGKLVGNNCKISLDNDSHIGENVDSYEKANNVKSNIDYVNTGK